MASSPSVVLMYFFLKSLSCSHMPSSEPQGYSLEGFCLLKWLSEFCLLVCSAPGHWQVIIFPTVFLLLVWIWIFYFFFPRLCPPKCGEAAWMQMFRPEASPPLKAKANVDSFAGSWQETHSSPLHSLPSPWQAVVPVSGEGSRAGLLPLSSWRSLSFLGPEAMPAPVLQGEQHNQERKPFTTHQKGMLT